MRVGVSSPRILGNRIEDNRSIQNGGGVAVLGSASPIVQENVFSSNQAGLGGGGIYVDPSASVRDTGGNAWPRQNCPPAGIQTEPVWLYQNNVFTGNTHSNGQATNGCHVLFALAFSL